MHVCVFVNQDIFVHVPALVTFHLYQLKRRKATCLFVLMFRVL